MGSQGCYEKGTGYALQEGQAGITARQLSQEPGIEAAVCTQVYRAFAGRQDIPQC